MLNWPHHHHYHHFFHSIFLISQTIYLYSFLSPSLSLSQIIFIYLYICLFLSFPTLLFLSRVRHIILLSILFLSFFLYISITFLHLCLSFSLHTSLYLSHSIYHSLYLSSLPLFFISLFRYFSTSFSLSLFVNLSIIFLSLSRFLKLTLPLYISYFSIISSYFLSHNFFIFNSLSPSFLSTSFRDIKVSRKYPF